MRKQREDPYKVSLLTSNRKYLYALCAGLVVPGKATAGRGVFCKGYVYLTDVPFNVNIVVEISIILCYNDGKANDFFRQRPCLMEHSVPDQ